MGGGPNPIPIWMESGAGIAWNFGPRAAAAAASEPLTVDEGTDCGAVSPLVPWRTGVAEGASGFESARLGTRSVAPGQAASET